MKFNAYIVRLKHRETSLTAIFSVPGKSVAVAAESAGSESPSEYVSISTNFKKIGPDLFIAQFKTQVELTFLEKFQLKNRDKEITVLLPVISKYNKRKVTKLSKLLANPEELERYHILAALSTIEKFLKIDELLHFFSFHREPLIEFLVEMELKQKFKIINFNSLSITSYENFQHYRDELNAILTQCYTGRTQELKLSEIEAKTKLPQSSLFLKYLVRTFG
ncbi:MAG: hypothetical protein GY950_13720, partial [bacterium]|nr:hypothetical protein [bacterium]